MATVLRPLTTGELLDQTFSLYRKHFTLFVGIIALPHLVLLAFQLAGAAISPPGVGLSAALWSVPWALGAGLLAIVVSAASQAATVVAVSQVYLDRPASVMDAFSRVKHQIGGVVWLSFLMGLGIGLGFLLLVVPGVLLALRWSLSVPAKVLENHGASDALSRSTQLTKGNRGRIFVIWLLFVVVSIAAAMLVQWPITIAAVMLTRGHGPSALVWIPVGTAVAGFISQCLAGPLITIALSLAYYDERVRKEAFDLQLMMATLDSSQLQPSPA